MIFIDDIKKEHEGRQSSWYIYVLALKDGYFYVGMTLFPYERILDHFNGNGANFTKRHNPERILELYTLNNSDRKECYKMEKAKAKEYAAIYGRHRVIGGKYLTLKKRPA